ncbi:MAG: 6'''-hydroxyparomomycin C oxidase [candidate division BRC1 bacterium ADurb.BinA364]|nr:MAG: 6'''-hydroxyparomomycin C oxidase [candidate division BRC1 bacterium ADurb.BinA364]
MEVLWVNSALLAARARGFGAALRDTIGQLHRTAFWCISIRGSSRGQVSPGWGWDPSIRFDLEQSDVDLLKEGIDLLAEHFFAAGARIVKPGVGGFDAELASADDLPRLKAHRATAAQLVAGGQHVFGTCSMGADPARAVVDSNHAAYGTEDLYVCDTGVFPSQTAVNPQLTLMAVAGRLAGILNQRY